MHKIPYLQTAAGNSLIKKAACASSIIENKSRVNFVWCLLEAGKEEKAVIARMQTHV